MPVWVILVVAGVLLVAALILVIAVHILDVHAEQQCAHLEDLTRRSLQQNQEQTRYQYQCGDSQLCCMCGNVRNRRMQVTNGYNSHSRAKGNPKLSTASGLLQPLMDAAYGKSALSSGSLDCLAGLTSRRKKMANELQGGWFNGQSFFRGNGGPEGLQSKPLVESSPASLSVAAAAAAASGSSSSAGSYVSSSRGVGGSDSDSMTTFTATISTASDSASSTSSSSSSSEAHPSAHTTGNQSEGWKSIPQRRLVLEILMSPSTTGDGRGGLPRATGVRLKLETNTSLESLNNLAAEASPGLENAVQTQVTDVEALSSALTSEFTNNVSCGPVSRCQVTTENFGNVTASNCALPSATSQHIKVSNIQATLAPVSTIAPNITVDCGSLDVHTATTVSSIAPEINTVSENEITHSGPSQGQAICSPPLDKRTGSVGSSNTVFAQFLAPVSCKTRSQGHTVGLNSPAKAKAKTGNTSAASSTSGASSGICPGTTLLKPAQSNSSVGLPLDGLGCLRIGFLNDNSKGKSLKDCSKGVTAEIASALAALSVDSIGGKSVGMTSSSSSGGTPSEASSRSCLSEKVDQILEEDAPGEASGSEQVIEEVDERHTVPEPVEEDEGDGNKKEKRKKKNRGRRQKAKAAAVAAAAAGVETQERHMIGKSGTEPVDIMHCTSESEIGCICGTLKGAGHSSSCPYPFTSSGSMVQRKIKEQYDDLVRSNVARTLTLAQVGRFTTCLVEAKSALQQKSETIQRRFTIAKSLLSKADKSSFDRLCGQIYGLEVEQKKLEEDTVVYNRLQEQLKLSPAYQKMLEYGRTHFELQPNTGQLIEKMDTQEVDISFEELLAQEKKDSFWQKHGPSRSSMQVS